MASHCCKRVVSPLMVTAARSVSSAGFNPSRRPLEGIKVIELSGLPSIPASVAVVPFCGLILADFGADVTVVRKTEGELMEYRFTRGKKINVLNLKESKDIKEVKKMCLESDVLLDPYNPGVIEKAGLNPVKLLEENEKLIVARITGFGQAGELSQRSARELNYVSMSGLLPTFCGHSPKRLPYWTPANLLAGFAGGSLMGAFGVVTALMHRQFNGGKGSIIDVSMVDALAYLGSFQTIYKDIDNVWNKPYAWFSGDCPVYRCYETSDGKFMAVGALERKFTTTLLKTLNAKAQVSDVWTKPKEVTEELEEIFKSQSRRHWSKVFRGVNACVTPVVDLTEVGRVRHHQQRDTFVLDKNKFIPQPAPRIYSKDEYQTAVKEINTKT